MVSIPARNPPSWHSRTGTPERLEPWHRSHNPFYHPVVRLNEVVEMVVEILALAQLNVKPGVLIDAMESARVGAAFVNRDFLRQAMQVDGSLQITLCRGRVSLGSE